MEKQRETERDRERPRETTKARQIIHHDSHPERERELENEGGRKRWYFTCRSSPYPVETRSQWK